LDLVAFYLDDGVLAGDLASLSLALRTLQEKSAQFGLQLNLEKCELVLPAGSTLDADSLTRLFPDALLESEGQSKVKTEGNFELLGCPIGDSLYCAAHTRELAAKVEPLLEELTALEDPQVSLRLLR